MNFDTLRDLYRYILPNETSTLFFYASFTLCVALWNVNIFINDEVTLTAQLLNLSHGTLALETMPARLYEGLSFGASAPVLGFAYEGQTYAFYTHAVPVFATPFYALLYLISMTVGIRLFFAWLWSFSVFMVCWLLGRRYNRERVGRNIGVLVAFVLLLVNAYLDTRLPPLLFQDWAALMAIQLFNILATAVIVVLSLRIFTRYFADERIAAFGALYILIATPLTFWAVSAKDHTASILLIMGSIWSLYVYFLDGKRRYHYLSYILVGLSFWVRIFDAIPLFAAILSTDMVLSTERIRNALTAVAGISLGMIPYFFNNYLLFRNPLLSPVYLSAHQEIGPLTTSSAADGGSAVFATFQWLPSLLVSTWNPQSLPDLPQNLYHALFYVNMPLTLSLFQLCPLLIIPLFAAVPYVTRTLRAYKSGTKSLRIGKQHAIALLFFIYVVVHLIIYAPFQNQGFGLDMRYFLPLYIPLLFFTLASIRGVIVHTTRIEKAFSGAWLILSASALVYIALFAPMSVSDLCAQLGFSLNRWLGTVTALLMGVFVPYFIGYRKRTRELALLVGFATFVSSYWLLIACWVWQKTPLGIPRPGMMLPLMEVVHRLLIGL